MAEVLAIRDEANNGFYNMAADICSMEMVGRGEASAVFRTYTWRPHCLSIGRFQKVHEEVDLKNLLADGYHAVRRPTGGRAVWHGDELTYSLIAATENPLVSGNISQSLGKVAAILLAAFHAVDIPAVMNRTEREMNSSRRKLNPCFTSHGRHEIMTSDGRKLVGSAQARQKGVFIEHGSILFTNMQHLAVDYMPGAGTSDEAEMTKKVLWGTVGSVREYSLNLTKTQLAEALHNAFQNAVGREPTRFVSKELPGLEEKTIERRQIIESR